MTRRIFVVLSPFALILALGACVAYGDGYGVGYASPGYYGGGYVGPSYVAPRYVAPRPYYRGWGGGGYYRHHRHGHHRRHW